MASLWWCMGNENSHNSSTKVKLKNSQDHFITRIYCFHLDPLVQHAQEARTIILFFPSSSTTDKAENSGPQYSYHWQCACRSLTSVTVTQKILFNTKGQNLGSVFSLSTVTCMLTTTRNMCMYAANILRCFISMFTVSCIMKIGLFHFVYRILWITIKNGQCVRFEF